MEAATVGNVPVSPHPIKGAPGQIHTYIFLNTFQEGYIFYCPVLESTFTFKR